MTVLRLFVIHVSVIFCIDATDQAAVVRSLFARLQCYRGTGTKLTSTKGTFDDMKDIAAQLNAALNTELYFFAAAGPDPLYSDRCPRDAARLQAAFGDSVDFSCSNLGRVYPCGTRGKYRYCSCEKRDSICTLKYTTGCGSTATSSQTCRKPKGAILLKDCTTSILLTRTGTTTTTTTKLSTLALTTTTTTTTTGTFEFSWLIKKHEDCSSAQTRDLHIGDKFVRGRRQTFDVATIDQCRRKCARYLYCNGFNYDLSKGICRYKADISYSGLSSSPTFDCYVYLRPTTTTTTTTRKRKGGCTGKCLGETCDMFVETFRKSCETLEQEFRGCDCSGCKCRKPKSATCDGSKIGSSAQHTSERDAHASTGYQAPGQPVGTKLSFPCRQGYESGLVRYTCGGDGKFHTPDKCIKIKTTPGPWGVWHAYEPSGCPTACGSEAGSGLVGDVRCSTDRCDLRTKPKPKRCAVAKCLQPCKMTRLISLAGSGVGCTMAMLGIGDPCDCLCNFALTKIQPLESCTMGTSNVDIHDQWRACAARRHGCGQGSGVVVVHGRRLRTA